MCKRVDEAGTAALQEPMRGVNDYTSYCRYAGSDRISNGRRKGRGNTKNGNKYPAWTYLEAANFAVRYNPQVKR